MSVMNHLRVLHGRLREKLKLITRSGRWPAARSAWLQDHPSCAACGGTKNVEVHHRFPFHLDPSMELDAKNFISLCLVAETLCHLRIGHGGSYSYYVPDVRVLADELLKNPANRALIEAKALKTRLSLKT